MKPVFNMGFFYIYYTFGVQKNVFVEFNVTEDCRVAFRNADFLMLITISSPEPNAPEKNFVENIEHFRNVFEKVKSHEFNVQRRYVNDTVKKYLDTSTSS